MLRPRSIHRFAACIPRSRPGQRGDGEDDLRRLSVRRDVLLVEKLEEERRVALPVHVFVHEMLVPHRFERLIHRLRAPRIVRLGHLPLPEPEQRDAHVQIRGAARARRLDTPRAHDVHA